MEKNKIIDITRRYKGTIEDMIYLDYLTGYIGVVDSITRLYDVGTPKADMFIEILREEV